MRRPTSSKGCWWARRMETLTGRPMWTKSWDVAKLVGPSITRRMSRLRAHPRYQCLMKRRRRAFFFEGYIIALRAMDMFPKFPLLLPVQPENPQEVWDAFCGGWSGIFVSPWSIRVDGGGEWRKDIWADLCAGLRIKLQFRGVGAHP